MQRTLVQVELSKHLMQSQDARKRFPRAVDALKSDDGQGALRGLIYKVCSNYRRRLRHKKRDPSNAAVEVLTQGGALPKSGPRLGSNLLCIVRPDGAIRAVCSLCELVPSWPEIVSGGGDTGALLDALSIEPLLCMLEKNHGYRRHGQRLGWVNYNSQGGPDTLIVGNDRQFRAAVAGSLKRYSIYFKII